MKVKENMAFDEIKTSLNTIRDWVRFGASQFNEAKIYFGHGTNNAWDEALTLVLFALHLSHEVPTDIYDAYLTNSEKEKIYSFIQQRIHTRKPLAYLTNQSFFAGLEFYVNENVLVPRSPIAELIENNFEPWIDSGRVHHILDLCTGSGCIAVACAAYFENATVDAVDISEAALAVAKINVEKHQLQNRVHLIHSDLFDALPQNQFKGKYDIIVSNPPYVNQAEYDALPEEYHREPGLGLVAGKDGLDIVEKILKHAPYYLADEGILVVEVGSARAALEEKFPQFSFLWIGFARGGEGVFVLTKEQLMNSN